MAKKQPIAQTIFQLKVILKYSKPPIWRRFQINSDITLAKLHRILQPLMGWWDGHLHQFQQGNICYADLNSEDVLECFDDAMDENKVKLNSVLKKEKQKILYKYDFGDSWEHDIVLEKILSAEAGVHYPICLDGKRSCPPEDCGGIGGYEDLLAILKDPSHPEHEERLEWIPQGFDPEEFELAEANGAIQAVK